MILPFYPIIKHIRDESGDYYFAFVDYIKLPYNIIIKHIRDESGDYYFASVLELDGCMSDGDTPETAYRNIQEAMIG
jgi:hypothetical protein